MPTRHVTLQYGTGKSLVTIQYFLVLTPFVQKHRMLLEACSRSKRLPQHRNGLRGSQTRGRRRSASVIVLVLHIYRSILCHYNERVQTNRKHHWCLHSHICGSCWHCCGNDRRCKPTCNCTMSQPGISIPARAHVRGRHLSWRLLTGLDMESATSKPGQ